MTVPSVKNLTTIASSSHLIGSQSSDIRSTSSSLLPINLLTVFFGVINAVTSGEEQIHLLSEHDDAFLESLQNHP